MILKTDKIQIELTRLENLPQIIQIEKNNKEFIGQYDFEQHKAVIENTSEVHLSVIDNEDQTLIGHIILAGLKKENDSIEFRRIVINKKGKGIGADCVRLTKEYCFISLNANRIWLDVLSNNKRAIGLYKSQGFKEEGEILDKIEINGRFHSLKIMSILKPEL